MKIVYYTIVAGGLFVISISAVFAQASTNQNIKDAVASFISVTTIATDDIVVPTVVDVPVNLDASYRRDSLVVTDDNTQEIIPSSIITKGKNIATPLTIKSQIDTGIAQDASQLNDQNPQTTAMYPISNDGQTQTVTLHFTTSTPVQTSQIVLQLDKNVALPHKVAVYGTTADKRTVVLATKQLHTRTITFPSVKTKHIELVLYYNQPLRLQEIILVEEGAQKSITQSVRFLAQPNEIYHVYTNADRHVSVMNDEMPDLYTDKGVHTILPTKTEQNNLYQESDYDDDSVPDERDNCVTVVNSNQEDVDKNGRGDACDDFDRDGVINSTDNCPNQPNRLQKDVDMDDVGDICDNSESRVLQAQKWLPMTMIILAGAVVSFLLYRTVRNGK